MFSAAQTLAVTDPELWSAIQGEAKRQEDHIELIASENYTSPAVMQAQGSVLASMHRSAASYHWQPPSSGAP